MLVLLSTESQIVAEYESAARGDPIAFASLFHYLDKLLLGSDPFLGWYRGRIRRSSHLDTADAAYAPGPIDAGAAPEMPAWLAEECKKLIAGEFMQEASHQLQIRVSPSCVAQDVPYAAERDVLIYACLFLGSAALLADSDRVSAQPDVADHCRALLEAYVRIIEQRQLIDDTKAVCGFLRGDYRAHWFGPSPFHVAEQRIRAEMGDIEIVED